MTRLGFAPGLIQPPGGRPSLRSIASYTSCTAVRSVSSSRSFGWRALVVPWPTNSLPAARNAATSSGQCS